MMRLIAITYPHFFKEECDAICRLLDSGWWRVHIRKPQMDRLQMVRLLSEIPTRYLNAISLHDHFDLAEKFYIGGVHLNQRNPSPPSGWQGMVSRSCHKIEEIAVYSNLDYLTLSPVYDSISKPEYLSQFNSENLKDVNLRNVFALGGVTFSRLHDVYSMGFAGAAMLSDAWKTKNNMLQFITHTIDGLEDVLKGGCRWVQLRMKDATDDEFSKMAIKFIPICRNYGATLIFDDRVHLVRALDADGVHLGKNDMPIAEARRLLGSTKIIGATANTESDVMAAFHAGADYIGVGPFRFTTTKKNLAPIIGLKGYREIMSQCRNKGMTLPVVAIGGITIDDLSDLKKTGVNGIAVSGLILNSESKTETTKKIINTWKN